MASLDVEKHPADQKKTLADTDPNNFIIILVIHDYNESLNLLIDSSRSYDTLGGGGHPLRHHRGVSGGSFSILL